MRDYSDAPAWATEAFFLKSSSLDETWYYGNATQYIYRSHIKSGYEPTKHTGESLRTICGDTWWREPINCIVENE